MDWPSTAYMTLQVDGEDVISELVFLYKSQIDLISVSFQIYFVDKHYLDVFKASKVTWR